MRALIALVLLAPLVTLTACSDEEVTTAPLPSTAVTTSPTLAPVTVPRRVSCPHGKPMTMQLDYGGDRSFTELLTAWTKERGRPLVDRSRRQIWFLRADGTAHTRLDWTHVRRPAADREWFVGGLRQCPDHEQWRSVAAPSAPVTLEVGHCWVEPVPVDGRVWDVVREDQFGWGGPVPEELTGAHPDAVGSVPLTGVLSPAGDVAVYVGDAGVRLTLVPAGDRWALTRRGCD